MVVSAILGVGCANYTQLIVQILLFDSVIFFSLLGGICTGQERELVYTY